MSQLVDKSKKGINPSKDSKNKLNAPFILSSDLTIITEVFSKTF